MKKSIILTTLMALFIISNANVVENITKTATNVVDSTTKAIKTTVTAVDTSSNFKLIYTDLKDGIAALASSLKVGAEHVYIVLVKQQVVISVTYIIVYLVGILLGFITYKLGNTSWEEPSARTITSIFTGIAAFCILIMFLITIQTTVSGIINPEYGAMKDIIDFVKAAKN